MTSVSDKQKLGLTNERILEIKIGFILLSIFTILSIISALIFVNHIWSENYRSHYKVIFAFELLKLVLITIMSILLYQGLSKLVLSFKRKSRILKLFTKIFFSAFLVVYYVLSVIYLLYSFDYMSSEDVADILGKDLVSMLVLTVSFLLLSLFIHREFKNHKSRIFLSFQSIFTFLIIPTSLVSIFLFTYADYAHQVNGDWQLYLPFESQIGLSFFFFYSLVVIVSSIILLLFFNRLSQQVFSRNELLDRKEEV